MALSNNIGTYADVMRLLATALAHLEREAAAGKARPTARFNATSVAAAIHTRQRAHKYRSLLGQENAAAGMGARTPYDALHLTIEGSSIVFVFRGGDTLPGTLVSEDGAPIGLIEEDEGIPDFDVEV